MVADDAEPKESGIGQEELDSIEKQFSELRALIDENIKFLKTKVNEKANKKDVETNLCKFQFCIDNQQTRLRTELNS